jgi:hypothetical protein
MYTILRSIRSDRTFTQDPYFSHIQPNFKQDFYSLDLTAATDRFPIELQKQVLTLLYDEATAESWVTTMVHFPFKLPESDDSIKYSVGQPMGARSS